MNYKTLSPPQNGETITMVDGRCVTPDRPIVPYIEGDGIGTDIWHAAVRVFDAAVQKAYDGGRKIEWFEVLSGEKAKKYTNEWMPEDTYQAFREFKVGIKGPLTTPVGGGFRSLNVTLRQVLDLYACVRPVRWFVGVPAPVKQPYDLDFIIFRENTEDVYSGIEYEEGSPEAKKLIKYLHDEFGANVRPDSGIGIKPISISGTERFVRKTMQYAVDNRRRSVTLVHKGNIMKFTEGAFREWGYDLVNREFADETVTEADLWDNYDGEVPEGKILVKDRIADNIFQQILLRPDEYDILCAPNLNGDYLSDAAAAQVGGLGMAPGANIGDEVAIFEATHGTAPKYAGKDVVNPSSVILSGEMMLRYMGWEEAADLVIRGVENAVSNRLVTQDLHRQMNNATLMKCSEFGTAIIEHMD